MRHFKLTALTLVLSALSATALAAEPAAPATTETTATATAAPVSGVHMAKVTARVAAVDTDAHTITLHYPKDQQTVIEVGEGVKNLAKMKVGNLALVRYADSLTLTPAEASAKGDNIYTVVLKNPLDHIAVLHGADGAMRVKVADDAGFKSLSVNEKLEVTSTKRVASRLSTVSRAAHRSAAKASAAE